MTTPGLVTVAASQTTPVFLDREATLQVIEQDVVTAASAGAQLVVFPEAILPGYPDWVWRRPAWSDGQFFARLADQAVVIPGPATDELAQIASASGVWVVVGITEKVRSGTLYNSLLYVAPDGSIAGVHRKLIPTGGERTVWGNGNGPVATVIDMGFARVGGLICWENLMPLARAAIYEHDIDIYLAPTWDNSPAWPSTLQHIAREGRVFVIGTNTCMHSGDVRRGFPAAFPDADDVYGDETDWCSQGNTTLVDPTGAILVGPLTGRSGILIETFDLDLLVAARREFDPNGHYARPDLLQLATRFAQQPQHLL